MNIITLRGGAFSIGEQLGRAGKAAWHNKLPETTLWQTVIRLKDSPQARAMAEAVQREYPLIWQELQGMACGLDAPLDAVFAWNCRGDLVRSTSDGCTTLAGRDSAGQCFIAHNEDGFPQLRDDCFIADIRPLQGSAFVSFAYPGSLCGHTFAVNQHGVVNTVNNIRAVQRPAGLPRQILARAALNATSLDDAVLILTATARAGAFHHTLGQAGDPRLFSVEATGQGNSVTMLTGNSGHANHLIHPQLSACEQVITGSSAARQHRIDQLLSAETALSAEQMLTILSDTDGKLPVYRLAKDDPDQENTLATVIFRLNADGVDWSLYGLDRPAVALCGEKNLL
ncbi:MULTISPECIES: C45 family autoproteolytic acyltransferase/hydolase [Tatumella]|uniref:C45 family autoproteolytic acyltransferase/hydrolase n=1 Tax=Tatumella punctata TaxID=399969 RepID=A0ABW1VNC3_9GAMM|nr:MULTISPECIES: C45 family peptidase [unclassified Tatumella]MBS0856367.1 acyl-CoA--6-aminopenicillanic acid acyl-transferase [Tatumella sp. JGM16]MBS0912517.1 acyl-CoA--6-aminopenicillanic acid acyl-transferase [Tatumella sp. JGM91]